LIVTSVFTVCYTSLKSGVVNCGGPFVRSEKNLISLHSFLISQCHLDYTALTDSVFCRPDQIQFTQHC